MLLNAENLKLKVNTELFLAGLCGYPLQVKIAFANWKNSSIGKLDAELYDRGSAALEASLVKIIRGLTAQSPGSYITIEQVASEFNKLYHQPITKKLQSLNLGSNMPKF